MAMHVIFLCGGDNVIVYKNVLSRLSAVGYSTYRIRQENVIPPGTVQRLRTGGAITTTTIETLCRLLSCQPGDLMEYIPDAAPAPDPEPPSTI